MSRLENKNMNIFSYNRYEVLLEKYYYQEVDMVQFSLDELKEIEEAVSGELKFKVQQVIKREENGVITTSGIFIPFSQALAIEVRRYEDGIIDTEVIHSILPFFYEKNYGKIYLNLKKTIEKSKKEINGDVTVTVSYDTETSIGLNTKFIKALRIHGIDTPINY